MSHHPHPSAAASTRLVTKDPLADGLLAVFAAHKAALLGGEVEIEAFQVAYRDHPHRDRVVLTFAVPRHIAGLVAREELEGALVAMAAQFTAPNR